VGSVREISGVWAYIRIREIRIAIAISSCHHVIVASGIEDNDLTGVKQLLESDPDSAKEVDKVYIYMYTY